VFCKRTTPPPPLPCTHHHPTLTHRPPSLFHMAPPKPSHSGSVSDFGLKPPPRLAFHKRMTPPPPPPCTHHHPTLTHCPPSSFHMACQKPSHSGSISDFGPKLVPHLTFREHSTPPPPPPHPSHCTTSLHCSPPSFPLVCLQLSSSGLVSDS
jgi:hypothetical protein